MRGPAYMTAAHTEKRLNALRTPPNLRTPGNREPRRRAQAQLLQPQRQQDGRDAESDRQDDGVPVEVLLHCRGPGEAAPHAAAEHVRKAATAPGVEEDEGAQAEGGDDVDGHQGISDQMLHGSTSEGTKGQVAQQYHAARPPWRVLPRFIAHDPGEL